MIRSTSNAPIKYIAPAIKNKTGRSECRSSGYRRGQEALARELAAEVERQASIAQAGDAVVGATLEQGTPKRAPPATSRAHDETGADSATGAALTVREYGEVWLERRVEVDTVADDAARLRLHVFPVLGNMVLAEVKPRHIRDAVNAIKQKTSAAPKCKGAKLAPRTVRHVFATMRLLFKSAVIDEHIAASPVVVEKSVLPKNVDKDPAWRSTAIFDRDELITLISDRRIARHRRVFNALEGLAGVRHGEAAGLRWCDYDPSCAPLGKLTVSRSGENERTKTGVTRELPVHRVLATILDGWKRSGWERKYGRAPGPDDLILPTERFTVRKPASTLKHFKDDLLRVGLRTRRGHDLRRTFITLAQVDGARRDVLKTLTHPGESDIVGLYTSFPWPTVCEAVAALQITLPAEDAHGDERANERPREAADEPVATVASYSPSYSDTCSLKIPSDLGAGARVRSADLRFTKPLLYH